MFVLNLLTSVDKIKLPVCLFWNCLYLPKNLLKKFYRKIKKIWVWTNIYSMREVRNGANISPCHKAGMDTDWERSRWCSIWCNVSDRENYLFIVSGDLLWQVASRYLINLLCWCISHQPSILSPRGAERVHELYTQFLYQYITTII